MDKEVNFSKLAQPLRTLVLIEILCLALSPGRSTAQTPLLAQTPPRLESLLPEGTPVRMRITRTISSGDMRVGDTVDFETLDDVRAADIIVIPKQSTAIATITEAEGKRSMARGGKLALNFDYVRLPTGEHLPLRGTKSGEGGSATTGGIAATAMTPFLLFTYGKDFTIPKGEEITVATGTDYYATRALAPVAPRSLTNTDVLRLKNAGLGDQLIIEKVKASPANYRLDTNDLIELKRQGISEAVIGAMLEVARQPLPVPRAPATLTNGLVSVPFDSKPSGALISFSGTPVCYAPCSLKLEPRRFKVTMTLPGYTAWTSEFTVQPGNAVVAEMQLAK